MRASVASQLVHAVLLCTLLGSGVASAGPLRDAIEARQAARAEKNDAAPRSGLPAGSQVRRDISYGAAPLQRFDVYLPAHAQSAPVILMVHGGGWREGDKRNSPVVDNKAAHYLAKGYIFVSTNYRLIPDADPIEQARDVAHALAAVQSQAASWGGDPARVVLMGHSAGAHLVALLDTDPTLSAGVVATPWLGTVALDSAAYDIEKIMKARHFPLYDRAFGKDEALWKAASPINAVTAATRPLLAVCSTRRDDSCAQVELFAAKASGLGVKTQVIRKDYSHRQINELLGADAGYTAEVDAFLAGLGLH
jgi:arylformamidase